MKRIASFEVNHDVLQCGMYISRIDGDIITYDLRMALPNSDHFLENDEMHTFEHLFATYARNSKHSDSVIYFGPMGCQTGFYFLTRDSLSHGDALALVQETLAFIRDFTGEIPGSSPRECGNAKSHDLDKAKRLGAKMADVLADWSVEQMRYLP